MVAPAAVAMTAEAMAGPANLVAAGVARAVVSAWPAPVGMVSAVAVAAVVVAEVVAVVAAVVVVVAVVVVLVELLVAAVAE